MFDFSTTHATPIPIRIDGTEYRVPRFLQPELQEWAAAEEKRIVDRALARIKDEKEQARFLLYFQPPPIDLGDAIAAIRSPAGSAAVFRHCLKAAGVPDGTIEAFIKYGDIDQKVALVSALTSVHDAREAVNRMAGVDEEEAGKSPKKPRKQKRTHTSADAPSTGAMSQPASASSSPASTQAA